MTTTRSQSFKNRTERQLSPQHVVIVTAKRKPRRRATISLKSKRTPTHSNRRRKRRAKPPKNQIHHFVGTSLLYDIPTERWKRQRRSPLKRRKRSHRRDQMASNKSYITPPSQISIFPHICSPLSRQEEPSQHSRLCLQQCNWIFEKDPLETEKAFLPTTTESDGPPSTWNWQAALDSHLKIYSEITQLSQSFFDGELVFQEQWGPLKGQEIRFVERGAVDSDSNHHTETRCLTPGIQSEDESSAEEGVSEEYPDPDEPYSCQIVCIPRNLSNSKLRSQWSFLDVIRPANINRWRLMNEKDIRRWDTRRASGNMMYNDESQDSDIWSSNSLARIMSITCYSWADHALESHYIEEELSARMKLGCLFASIMKTDITKAYCLERPLSPSLLTPCSHPVFSDVVAIPSAAVLPWDCGDPIVLFAAQYRDRNIDDAITQLAHSLQSGINILILYYLETRQGGSPFLPQWMYLYGIVYSESGFRIYTHYPLYQPGLSTGSGMSGWSARSTSVDFDIGNVFNRPAPQQASAIAALLRIQSHIRFVVNRLSLWDGFGRIVQHFNTKE